MTRNFTTARTLALGALLLIGAVGTANAVVCAKGVYRAGCAGPNGAAVAHRPVVAAPVVHGPVVHAPTCVNGVYRAGCVGPNGAAVVAKPVVAAPMVNCRYVNGVKVCR